MSSTEPQFALYVSAVKGTAVERLGHRGVYIGAQRRPPPEGWAWDEDAVIGLTALEVAKYRREYEGMIERNELKRRTHEDYVAANKAIEDRANKDLADRVAAQKAAEAKAEKEKADAEAKAKKGASAPKGQE